MRGEAHPVPASDASPARRAATAQDAAERVGLIVAEGSCRVSDPQRICHRLQMRMPYEQRVGVGASRKSLAQEAYLFGFPLVYIATQIDC